MIVSFICLRQIESNQWIQLSQAQGKLNPNEISGKNARKFNDRIIVVDFFFLDSEM